MRAAVLKPDAPPQIADLPKPTAGDGEAALEVRAAGINPIDLAQANANANAHPDAVAGREGVGELEGKRYYFGSTVAPHGAAAETTVVARDRLVEIPDAVEDGVAIALGVAGQAAWLGLEWRAALRPGEHVLVLGASGTVGEIAVQAARLLGAGRVIAAARSEEGLEHARAKGADAVVRIGDTEPGDLAAAIGKSAEGRVDVILDPLWGMPAAAAMQAASSGARLVQLGSAASKGKGMDFNPASLRGRLVSVLAFSAGVVPLEVRVAAYERTLGLAAEGELTARVHELPLESVAEAWELQRSSPHAKLALRIS